MALIHEATLTPDKLELLAGWLPTRPWSGPPAAPEKVGTYRFDDPAGEVGVESFLLRTGDGVLLHVPLTYRGAPLDGAEEHLVGVMEHSVLGTRWVYDGCADPVHATTLAATVLTGGTQADLVMAPDAGGATLSQSVTVTGSGSPGTPVPEVTAVTCVRRRRHHRGARRRRRAGRRPRGRHRRGRRAHADRPVARRRARRAGRRERAGLTTCTPPSRARAGPGRRTPPAAVRCSTAHRRPRRRR